MKKALYLLLFALLFSSCGMDFSKRKYTKFRVHSHKAESINRENEPVECPIKTIDKPNQVIEKSKKSDDLSGITDTTKKSRKEKKSAKEYQSRPREQLNSTGNSSGGNENLIRQKTRRSVFVGIASIGAIALSFYGLSIWIYGLFLAAFIIGGLLAFIGVRLAIASKRDMDQISDRSSKKKMNRMATFAFILNLIPLVITGLLLLMMILSAL